MGRIGGTELLVILLVALLIFGPSKLADLGKSLGEGLKNFKKGISSEDEVKPPPPPGPGNPAQVAAPPPVQPGGTANGPTAPGPGDPNRSPPAPSGSG